MNKTIIAALAAAAAWTASAGIDIDLDLKAKPIKDMKKTANGIVVNVPMDDYMQLTMMKFHTGRTLKDLALQAIHEFVERNKM